MTKQQRPVAVAASAGIHGVETTASSSISPAVVPTVQQGSVGDPDTHIHKIFSDLAGKNSSLSGSPKGLTLEGFLLFCSTTGLLVDSSLFSEADAERVFNASKKSPSASTLEYEDFRIVALSKISAKKGLSAAQLLYLMSACASLVSSTPHSSR